MGKGDGLTGQDVNHLRSLQQREAATAPDATLTAMPAAQAAPALLLHTLLLLQTLLQEADASPAKHLTAQTGRRRGSGRWGWGLAPSLPVALGPLAQRWSLRAPTQFPRPTQTPQAAGG